MGQEISADGAFDEVEFKKRLRDETRIVLNWFKSDAFERRDPPLIGAEVEAWLLDADCIPDPCNARFIEAANMDGLDSELSQFNFELNLDPQPLGGDGLKQLEAGFNRLWTHCCETAKGMGGHAAMIGILPTLRDDMLCLDTMTPSNRYRALNDRVMAMRSGEPLSYDISGLEHLEKLDNHLMMEGACTSLQSHLMLDPDRQARQFNAAMIASAPVLAVATNSPFLYGRQLWEETRIPAFEQAIRIMSFRDKNGRAVGRVDFGTGYVRDSLMELFLENLDGHPPLLAALEDAPPERLRHLKLQNGTLWRWNRPIVDVDAEGVPHLRLENRITPAGPTPADMAANVAFLLGLSAYLAQLENAPELNLPFETARQNFYAAARHGLGARLTWIDGREGDVQALIGDTLVDQAEAGLLQSGVDAAVARHFIDIIRGRVRHGMTGSIWQRGWVDCHGRDFQGLVSAYLDLQTIGNPVHTWTL